MGSFVLIYHGGFMRAFFIVAVIGSILSVFPATANAAVCDPVKTTCITTPLSSCTTVGQTTMDHDQRNIISCVCNTVANCGAADLVWKSMTSKASNLPLSFGGLYMLEGQDPTGPCRWGNPQTGLCTCPPTYKAHQLWDWNNPVGGAYGEMGSNVSIWACYE